MQRMHRLLASEAGGFIGYVEEYGCMGMSQENHRAPARLSVICPAEPEFHLGSAKR